MVRELFKSIQLQNVLSYGPDTPGFELGPLNILIGPNASGKSNLIEALSIIAAAPRDIQTPLREGGGIHEWTWKGVPEATAATVQLTVGLEYRSFLLRYELSFHELSSRFMLLEEIVDDSPSREAGEKPTSFYRYELGKTEINVREQDLSGRRLTQIDDVKHDQSILSQRRDPRSYPELTSLATLFDHMRFYREFHLGYNSPLRRPQQADLPQEYLLEDGSNLAVVLSEMLNEPGFKKLLVDNLQDFYPSVRDVQVVVRGGSVQVSFHEEGTAPFHSLSTFRWYTALPLPAGGFVQS